MSATMIGSKLLGVRTLADHREVFVVEWELRERVLREVVVFNPNAASPESDFSSSSVHVVGRITPPLASLKIDTESEIWATGLLLAGV